MNVKELFLPGCLSALIFVSGCAGVEQQVKAGRAALQTGRPNDAVAYLMPAAVEDPNYATPSQVREGVFTYLGWAYYETGNDEAARSALEKALAKNKDDPLAHLYLGLVLTRNGNRDRGQKEIESGLKGIQETLDYVAADSFSGIYWDPGMQIRSEINKTLNGKLETPELVASAQRIGRLYDEEIDSARRDEAYNRYGRGGGGGGGD
jgi:tetratricopeptide (TPR) repeat protein